MHVLGIQAKYTHEKREAYYQCIIVKTNKFDRFNLIKLVLENI